MKKILLALISCCNYSSGMLHELNSYDSLVKESLIPIAPSTETFVERDGVGVPIWLTTIKRMDDAAVIDFMPSLCKLGIDINASDMDGNALVHILALRNLPTALEVLLSHFEKASQIKGSIKIDKLNCMRETALDLAVAYKGSSSQAHRQQLKMIKLLLSHGAQVNFNNWIQGTPLHYAVWHWNCSCDDIPQLCVMNILTKVPDVDVNAQNKYGETPLSIAIYWENVAAVEALLKTKKIDFNIVDENKETVTQQAIKKKNREILRLIRKHA